MIVRHQTSESVTEGHPDKVCDQVSDAILDVCLAEDPHARVAVETLACGNDLTIAGEVTTTAALDAEGVARDVMRRIGYVYPALGFNAATCSVRQLIHAQSPDIAQGVERGCELGAGDQGIMYGYACDETPTLMPASVALAHALARRLADARHRHELEWLRPDGKTQVTFGFDEDGRPAALESVLVSAQHDDDVSQREVVEGVLERVVLPVVGRLLTTETRVLVNPTGRFVLGGPAGDTGLTGRKIIVDTYGGVAHHGGGAFSGKDPTKVDRTGAYMARKIAKDIVAAQLATRCEVSVAYAIGQIEPAMVNVETFGTGRVEARELERAVRAAYPLTVSGMIAELDLTRPQFLKTAANGHFGREGEGFAWEERDPGRIRSVLRRAW